MAAISYDTVDTLRAFGTRTNITYPMLADPGSNVIRQFRMIDPDNSESNVPSYGARFTAYPGYFVANRSGVVVERLVDPRYDDRRTGAAAFATLFPELVESAPAPVDAPHASLRLGQTDSLANLGSHIRLVVDLELPDGMHVYAPSVKGYLPVKVAITDSDWLRDATPDYPRARTKRLEAIKESVPVYEGKLRIPIDVVIANRGALMRDLTNAPEQTLPIAIEGKLSYQACDAKVCYLPVTVPLKWEVRVKLPDRTRANGE